MSDWLSQLPDLRGRLRAGAELAKANWFQVGGLAEVLFKPEDTDDLAYFIANKPAHLPVTVLGVGSNLLVRDGGIDGVVIRLGKGFVQCAAEDDRLVVGAGCLNANAVMIAQEKGVGGLEFLSGIPGNIGGALAMNAGAYGAETKDILIEAQVLDLEGRSSCPHAGKTSLRLPALRTARGLDFHARNLARESRNRLRHRRARGENCALTRRHAARALAHRRQHVQESAGDEGVEAY